MDIVGLYATSFYWVITSFSSIGYGEITPNTKSEIQYTLLIEMLGIGVFGYMIGTIQTLFIGLGQTDQLTEQNEAITLWLVRLDRLKQTVLSRKVFDDVRDYYTRKFKHDTKLVVED